MTNKQITDLTLTPRLVARLLSDSDVLTFFDDPEFQKLNPDHHWPVSAAEPGLRGEKNADTWIVTNWLEQRPERAEVPRRQGHYGVAREPGVEGRALPDRRVRGPQPERRRTSRASARKASRSGSFPRRSRPTAIPDRSADVGFIGVLDLPDRARVRLPDRQAHERRRASRSSTPSATRFRPGTRR